MKIIIFIGFIGLCASVSGHVFRHRHRHPDPSSDFNLDFAEARHFPPPPHHHPHVHNSDCHHQPDEGHLNPYNPYPMGPNFGHPHPGHPPHTGWYGNEFYPHHPSSNPSLFPSSHYPQQYPGMYPIQTYPGGSYPNVDTKDPLPLDPTSILNKPPTQPDVFTPTDHGSVNNNPNTSGNTIPTNNNNHNNNNGFQDNTIFTTTQPSADSTDYINLIDVRFGDKTKLPSKRPNRK